MSKKLKYLVIHCTATPEGRDIQPGDVLRWHTDPVKHGGRGWKQVGYSKLILLNGFIHSFVTENDDDIVDAWEITNGAAGINSVSRHICYVGGCDAKMYSKDTRTLMQLSSMEALVKSIVRQHPDILVAGHSHFAKKACPSFNVEFWCEAIGLPEKNIFRKGMQNA